MLFTILTEASSDAISQAIDLLNMTSNPVKSALTDDYDYELYPEYVNNNKNIFKKFGTALKNLGSKVVYSVTNKQTLPKELEGAVKSVNPHFDATVIKSSEPLNALHWEAAEKLASESDKELLAKAFTLISGAKYPQYNVVLNNAEDIWVHIMSDLGYNYKDNPFLRYVYYYPYFEPATVRQQLITLNNLYSGDEGESVITAADLSESNKSILYNKALWLLSDKDIQSILEDYYYAKKHRSSLNLDASPNKAIEIRKRVAAAVDGHDSSDYKNIPIENYIVFKDTAPDAATSTEFDDSRLIHEFVETYMINAVPTIHRTTKSTDKTSTTKLTGDKKTAIKKFLSDSRFTASDIDTIKDFLDELVSSGAIR